jgi:protein PET100
MGGQLKWGALEVFKFCCYISIPIGMTVAISGSPKNLENLIKNRDYVVYPPEGPRPPTADELHELVKKEQQRRAA